MDGDGGVSTKIVQKKRRDVEKKGVRTIVRG